MDTVKIDTINGEFKNINLSNWSGEEVDIVVKNDRFEMQGYKWEIQDAKEEFMNFKRGRKSIGGHFKLKGDDWEDANTLYVGEDMTPESIVKAAVAWIGNFV